MAMQAHEIEDLIRLAFPDAKISIEDLRGDGDHYSCMVESAAFWVKRVFSNIRWFIIHLGDVWADSCTHLPYRQELLKHERTS